MNELLNAIDTINESVNDSEISVLESLISAYEKSLMILESSVDVNIASYSIFQEGEILDQAKGNSSESLIKRILLFIPRLIKALIQKLFKLNKDNKKMTNEMIDAAEENKQQNKPCDIKLDLVTDLNEGVTNLLFEVKDIDTINDSLDKIDRIQIDGDQVVNKQIITQTSSIFMSMAEKCKTKTNALNNIMQSPKSYSFKDWDQIKSYLSSGFDVNQNGVIKYLNQMLNDISETSADLSKKLTSKTSNEFTQVVQSMKRLVDELTKFVSVYAAGIIHDRSKIHKAMGLDVTSSSPDNNDTIRSGMRRKDNERWDPNSVSSPDISLLKQNKNLLDKYMNGGTFTYFSEHKYPALPKDVRDNLFKLFDQILTEQNYERYKDLFNNIRGIFGYGNDHSCIIEMIAKRDMMIHKGDLGFRIKTESETFPRNNNVSLYHTTTRSGLTELEPTFKSDNALFPVKRVYFGYNAPVSRYGGTPETPEDIKSSGVRVYMLDQEIPGEIWKDTELRGPSSKACFINTDTPLRVKDVTEQFVTR